MKETSFNILYVGPMVEGSTTVQRARALESIGHDLYYITTETRSADALVKPSMAFRLKNRLLGQKDRAKANKKILDGIKNLQVDILWIDKGLSILPDTLEEVKLLAPETLIVGFSPDDMLNKHNQSKAFLDALPFYDAFITTKSFHQTELRELGCNKVIFINNSFDPSIHRPMKIDNKTRKALGGPVGFIGQWEEERAEFMYKLAQAGVRVRIWGYTWERMKVRHPNLIIENQPLWGDQYARAICAFDINLCFLRKINRDLQTTRSVEIPACGGFMLAERTNEHLNIFKEKREAEFFDSADELIEKVFFYLEHPTERKRIAQNGYMRCLESKYSYAYRLEDVLQIIMDK